jgi:hypothetical protein
LGDWGLGIGDWGLGRGFYTKLHSYVADSFSPRPRVWESGRLSQLLCLNATAYYVVHVSSITNYQLRKNRLCQPLGAEC